MSYLFTSQEESCGVNLIITGRFLATNAESKCGRLPKIFSTMIDGGIVLILMLRIIFSD